MTAKEWLNRGWELNNEINDLLERQQKALARACSTTVRLCKDKVQTSTSNSTENKMIEYADYEPIINRKIDKLCEIKCEILNAIMKLDNATYKKLLIERYIRFKDWDEVAEAINKNRITTRGRIHGRALREICQYIV